MLQKHLLVGTVCRILDRLIFGTNSEMRFGVLLDTASLSVNLHEFYATKQVKRANYLF